MATTKRLELLGLLHELTLTTLRCVQKPPIDVTAIESLTRDRQELVAELGQLSDAVTEEEVPVISALLELTQELEQLSREEVRKTAKELLDKRPQRNAGQVSTPLARIISQSA